MILGFFAKIRIDSERKTFFTLAEITFRSQVKNKHQSFESYWVIWKFQLSIGTFRSISINSIHKWSNSTDLPSEMSLSSFSSTLNSPSEILSRKFSKALSLSQEWWVKVRLIPKMENCFSHLKLIKLKLISFKVFSKWAFCEYKNKSFNLNFKKVSFLED